MGPEGEGVEIVIRDLHAEPEEVVVARLHREARERIIAKMASQQLGELWCDDLRRQAAQAVLEPAEGTTK